MPDCFSSEDISIHHKRVRRSLVPLVQGKPSYGRISEVVAHFPLAHYFLDDGFLTTVVVFLPILFSFVLLFPVTAPW